MVTTSEVGERHSKVTGNLTALFGVLPSLDVSESERYWRKGGGHRVLVTVTGVLEEKWRGDTNDDKKHKASTVLLLSQFNVRDHVEHWQSMLENVSGNPGATENPGIHL